MPTAKFRESYLKWVVSAANIAGSPRAFVVALGMVIVWGCTGPFFHFSQNWENLIATFTSTISFLLLFILQNSQNREIRAFQLKLDEIIRATEGAKNTMVSLEKLSDEELALLSEQYQILAEESRKRGRHKIAVSDKRQTEQ